MVTLVAGLLAVAPLAAALNDSGINGAANAASPALRLPGSNSESTSTTSTTSTTLAKPPRSYQPRTDCIRGSLNEMNNARAADGAAPLVWDENLFRSACAQAYYNAYYQHLYHWVYGNPVPFIGENVGTATSEALVIQSWLNSSQHRSNIVASNRRGAAVAYVTTPFYGSTLYWGVAQFN